MTLHRLLWAIVIVFSLYVWWSLLRGRVHGFSKRGLDITAVARWENPCAYWFMWGVYFALWVVMLVKLVPAL